MKMILHIEMNDSPNGRYISEEERGEGGVTSYFDILNDKKEKIASGATHYNGDCCITVYSPDGKYNRIDLPKGAFKIVRD